MGASGTIEEIVEKVVGQEGFTEEQQAVPHGDGPQTQIEYRLAWARSYLKGMGALNNSERGVWSTTELGRTMTPEDVAARHSAYKAQLRETRRAKRLATAEQEDGLDEDESAPRDWKERLLEVLLDVPPDSFERLARRLIREAGFVSATVTGKSGDGGIDGIGVYRLSLVSFPVFFQLACRDIVRAWRELPFDAPGPMTGRAGSAPSTTRSASRARVEPRDALGSTLLCMRTTIMLDDEVFRAFKQRAAERGTSLTREIEEALRSELAASVGAMNAEPYQVPIFRGTAPVPASI